ncbi:MAG TPA: 3'(2'),5'-bisphosphate nucleotidase, partial [Planctomycetes bacterium]|nr:3'(2'),5'-bisphosphate nucleotidase [Planctomycetota bacterium]
DPIDGTKGFLRGEHYAVALALLAGNQVQVAALACPQLPCGEHTGTLAWAIRGEGAFMVPLDEPEAAPVRLAVAQRPLPEARQLESVEPGHHDRERAERLRSALG